MTMTTTVESERYDDDDDDSAVLVWMVDRGKRECEEKMQSLTVIVVTVNQSKLTKRCQYIMCKTHSQITFKAWIVRVTCSHINAEQSS